jgi:hypothetical protein
MYFLKRINLTFVVLKERLFSSQYLNHLGVATFLNFDSQVKWGEEKVTLPRTAPNVVATVRSVTFYSNTKYLQLFVISFSLSFWLWLVFRFPCHLVLSIHTHIHTFNFKALFWKGRKFNPEAQYVEQVRRNSLLLISHFLSLSDS